MSRRIAMNGLHILLFSFCLASSGLAKAIAPLLAYQDSLGQYSFGYSDSGSARSEVRTLNGETRGAYSYLDDAGIIQTVHYVADGKNGFRIAATNLPEAPVPVRAVQEEQTVVLTRAGTEQTEEKGQKAPKIGENNIFLKDLQSSERKIADSSEKDKLETNEGGNATEGAKEGIKLGENENLAGKLTSGSQGQAQSESSQNENSKLSDNKATLEGLKQSAVPILRISEGDTLAEPSSTKIPISNQGSSLTPASTTKLSPDAAKENEKLNKKESAGQSNEEQGKPQDEIKLVKPDEILLKPATLIRPNPVISYLPRYTVVPAIRYVIYNN